MQRQRDGLVPIGEAFGGLDGGPVKELRDASTHCVLTDAKGKGASGVLAVLIRTLS